jgi:hypothetical protein
MLEISSSPRPTGERILRKSLQTDNNTTVSAYRNKQSEYAVA